jgi:adenosylhomocysteine nucleosidase
MIGIIGAMEEEVRLLRELMEGAGEYRLGPFVAIAGRLNGVPAALLRCGIGKVNAAVGAALLMERFKPRCIVNTGSAGGIGKAGGIGQAGGVGLALAGDADDLTFGDVVIADALRYHDVDVTAFGYAPGQLPGQAASFPVDPALAAAAERAVEAAKAAGALPADQRHRRGEIASGDVFVHDPALIAAIRAKFPAVCAVEMEGAAVAQVCSLYGVPMIAIRAISDVAGRESPMKFDQFLPLASRHSCEIVCRLVKEL